MMSTLTIGKYELEIDLELTKEMYHEMPRISETCSCEKCKVIDETISKNYDLFHKDLSEFGIQINKSPEIFEQYRSEDGVSHYMGIFHIVGRIVSGADCWEPLENGKQLDDEMLIPFEFGNYGFTREVVLARREYRHDVFQMELLLDLPGLPVHDEPKM